jgi:hypothetical protein
MSAPEVADIVGTCNPVALTRVVKELGEPSAAVDVDDPASVARVVMTSLREIGPRAHRRTNLALSALVQPAWRAVVEALGARSTDPSIDDLTRAFHAVSTEIPISACRLVVAVGIEQRVPAESALRELAESDQRFAVVEKQGGVVIPLREAPKPDTRTREQRRRRRKEQAAERRARDDQRQQATPFEGGELPLRDDVDDDTPAVRIDEIASMRAVHPRLPAGVDGAREPVGFLGTAYITWGRGPDEGKRRPVVIIGASGRHLWVRPCYSRDYVAGGWRAVRIVDWADAGLAHEGFVAIDVVKLKRSAVTVTRFRFTDRDWNAMCRGEIQVD